MTKKKDWKSWSFNEEIASESYSSKSFLSKKFKALLFIFFSLSIFLLNIDVLEVLSLADGKVIPKGRIKYIQHLEGGIVEDILIKEGEKVQSNQPLIILSKEKAS